MTTSPPAVTDDPQEEIAALVRTLHDAEQRLQELAGGEVDAVILPGGHSYLLHEAQEKLRLSEAVQHDLSATQSSILNALPAHIALLDHEGAILSVNDGWRRFAENNGLQSSAAGVGRNYLEVCDRAHGRYAEEAYQAAAGIRAILAGATGEFAIEYPCHSPTEQRWFQLRVNPMEHYEPRGAVVMHVAITERRRAEEELRWKTAFLEAQVSASLDGLLVVDPQGKKILQNQRLNELLKIPRHIADEPDDGEQLRWVTDTVRNPERFLAKVVYLNSHPDESARDEIELKDGTILDRYSAPVVGKSEKYYGRIWTFRDITERRQAEARIAEQAALIDEARDAIVVRDLEHRIIFWSKGAERLYGWTAEEARGSFLHDLLRVDAVSYAEADRAVRETGVWNGEIQKHARNGKALTLDGRWTLVRDSHGRAQSILNIDTDITDRKKLEQQFLRAQRMESIGTLAGGIAHDLNNILAPILMSVALLKLYHSDSPTQEILTTLERSCRRGADMVEQILGFARGVAGQRIPVNLFQLMRDLVKMMQDTFPKSIDVRCPSAERGLWLVTGDATQLHQVFLNLCVNARDAMPGGGKLDIGMENMVLDETCAEMNPGSRPGAYVLVQVTDTGTGIPPEILDRIFEPFFTTKDIGKGTGLGLSTTAAIVKSHGGFISLYSEMGQGTKFNVYLPANVTAATADGTAIEQTELPRGNGELVLVVDDEEAIRSIARRTLERFGYRVLLACNGAEAIALYARHGDGIAAVLTDMAMPIMDGPALIVALKALNPAVRIICSSGLDAKDNVAMALGASVRHFVPKPYTAEVILKTLHELLGSRESAGCT